MTDQLIALRNLGDVLSEAFASTMRGHERAELLAAYRVRHRWKASDAARLRTLKLSPVAERRVAKLRGRGRPIVTAHSDPLTGFLTKLFPLIAGFRFDASRKERLYMIKHFRWWPHYVEAVYRGELEVAKADKLKSPAEATGDKIADALGISSAVVRKLCTSVRKLRQEEFESADFPAARLAGFMEWINDGRRDNFLPLDLADGSGASVDSRPALPASLM